jgi:hypothetical protein
MLGFSAACRPAAEGAALGPPPRLGLNCVGGEAALSLCKALAEGGTLVTCAAG